MELMRPALSAKVAQPMITPIDTPGTKPHRTMMKAIASTDRYSSRASCRAVPISQRLSASLAIVMQQAAKHAFGHVGDKSRIDEQQCAGHRRDREAGDAAIFGECEIHVAACQCDAGDIAAECCAQQVCAAKQR